MSNGDFKGHVKRIYGKPVTRFSEAGWVDVLRRDLTKITYASTDEGKRGLATKFKFKWNDTDPQDAPGNPSRETHYLEIKNPDNENDVIKLSVVDSTKITQRGGLQPGDDSGKTYQNVKWKFQNDPTASTSRKTTRITVLNNDLGDPSNVPAEDGSTDWDTYLQWLRDGKQNKDKGKLDNVEIPDSFLIDFGPDALKAVKGQKIRYGLGRNKSVEQLFDAAGGEDDLLRTDPLQCIVNVHWGPPVYYGFGFWFRGGGSGFNLPGNTGRIDFVAATACFAQGYTVEWHWIPDTSFNDPYANLPPYVQLRGRPSPPSPTNFGQWTVIGATLPLRQPDTSAPWFFQQKGGSCTGSLGFLGHPIDSGGSIGFWGDSSQGQQVGDFGGPYAGGSIICGPNIPVGFSVTATVSGLGLSIDGVAWEPHQSQVWIYPDGAGGVSVPARVFMGTTFKPPGQKS